MDKRFHGIIFTVDRSNAVVPKCWLVSNGEKCLWPSKAPLKKARTNQPPQLKGWKSYECEVVTGASKFNL